MSTSQCQCARRVSPTTIFCSCSRTIAYHAPVFFCLTWVRCGWCTRRHGTIIGHIAAKGLHTNLLLQVGVTEDCRFAFAGVLRGSAQMLAWDLSYLPTWAT